MFHRCVFDWRWYSPSFFSFRPVQRVRVMRVLLFLLATLYFICFYFLSRVSVYMLLYFFAFAYLRFSVVFRLSQDEEEKFYALWWLFPDSRSLFVTYSPSIGRKKRVCIFCSTLLRLLLLRLLLSLPVAPSHSSIFTFLCSYIFTFLCCFFFGLMLLLEYFFLANLCDSFFFFIFR